MPSNHLILCHPLLLLPSILPSIRVLSNESAFGIRWPKCWSSPSASVLPMNMQGWFPLGLTGLISLLSKGLSRVFSSTTVWKYQFWALSFLYGPTLTSIHDYWKNHSFDYTDLCWQSDVSAFLYNGEVGHSLSSKEHFLNNAYIRLNHNNLLFFKVKSG